MPDARCARGFSLLEMLVAIAILALTLGALYQAVSGATRNLRSDERYAYAVELARSLLADNTELPAAPVDRSGETSGGFQWRLRSGPIEGAAPGTAADQLRRVEVEVAWPDGRRSGRVTLHSVAGVAAR